MPSEFNQIDNFFRNKDREIQPDTGRLEADWSEMKKLLKAEAALLPNSTLHILKPYRKWIPRAAAAILVVIAAFVLVPLITKNKKPIIPVAKSSGNPGQLPGNSKIPVKIAELKTVNSVKITEPQKIKEKIIEKNFTYDLTPIKKSQDNNISLIKHGDKDKKPAREAKQVFDEFYSTLEKPAEEFIIDNRVDTLIRCQQGTTLFIPAGSFYTVAGMAVIGAITVRIREFYSYADMISHKLSTSSEGKRLETAGMININAISAGQELKIKEDAYLELKMPTGSFDPNMQLFEGNPVRNASFNGIDWKPAGQQQFFFKDNKRLITILNLTDNPYEITNYKNGTKTLAKFMIPYDSPLSVDEIKTHLENKFSKYYDKIKVKREWGPLFGKKRKDTVVSTHTWYESKQVGDSITIHLDLGRRLKMVSEQDSIYYETLWRKQYEDAVKQKQAWSEYLQKREAYSFRISNLGWINCDRFVEYPKGRLTDFVLNPGEGFEGGTFNAILILENERSAMQGSWSGGKIRFPSLPLGHRVNIICTGVKNGVMYTAVQQATITRTEIDDIEFEPSSPEEFREKLLPFGDVSKPN